MIVYTLFPALLLVCYGGLLALWLELFRRPDASLERVAVRVGWAALALYALWMLLITTQQRQIPILTVGQISVFLGFLIWADQLYVNRRVAQKLLVVLPLSIVILLLIAGLAAGFNRADAPLTLQSPWSAVHITLSMAGLAMLFGGGIFSAGSLLLHRQLKERRFGRLFSALPSMDDMRRLRALALYLGWLLVTVSFASSILFMFVSNAGSPTYFTHLHVMFAFWVIVSLLTLSERLQWLGDHRQARITVAVMALLFVIITVSLVEIFVGSGA